LIPSIPFDPVDPVDPPRIPASVPEPVARGATRFAVAGTIYAIISRMIGLVVNRKSTAR